jgi:hypothetical protein
MRSAARLGILLALFLALVAVNPEEDVAAYDQGRLVAPGRLVIAGRRLSCGATATLVRDFEGFAVSSTVIMLNMQAMKDLPRPVQWLIYYHECGHILYGPSETAADCYAVRRARREGWLNQKALDDVCAVFNIAGHGPLHPDPEARCNQLRQCFAKKGGITAPRRLALTCRNCASFIPAVEYDSSCWMDGHAWDWRLFAPWDWRSALGSQAPPAPRNGPAMKARPPQALPSINI